MKKKSLAVIISIVLFATLSDFLPVTYVQAQVNCDPDDPACPLPSQTQPQGNTGNSISGDGLCGASSSDVCTAKDLETLSGKLFLLFASVGSALLVIFILIRIIISVKAYMVDGNAAALAQARRQSFNMLMGFAMVMAVFGGIYLVALQYLGTKPEFLNLLKFFSEANEPFISYAYAQPQNPLGANNAYDVIIAGVSLGMRFFVYPALIAMWVAAGFKFVYSQGRPEGIKTARNWLLVAFIVTVVAFTLQGFIFAFRATATKVFQGAGTGSIQVTPTNTNTNTNGTVDGRGQPATPTSPGAQCQDSTTGAYGIWDLNGKCVVSARGQTEGCAGKSQGATCTTGGRTGTCTSNDEGVFGCYVNPTCYGQIGLDGECYTR